MPADADENVSPYGSVRTSVAHAKALEAELQELRTRAAEKDREIEALKRVQQTRVTPLSGTFAKIWSFRSESRRVPVVGSFARIGEMAADACLRRTSPWESCEDLAECVGGVLRYVDERVITPQVWAVRWSSNALTSPVVGVLKLPREVAAALTQRAISRALWVQAKFRSFGGRPAALHQEALEGPDDWNETASLTASTKSSENSFLAAAAMTRRKASLRPQSFVSHGENNAGAERDQSECGATATDSLVEDGRQDRGLSGASVEHGPPQAHNSSLDPPKPPDPAAEEPPADAGDGQEESACGADMMPMPASDQLVSFNEHRLAEVETKHLELDHLFLAPPRPPAPAAEEHPANVGDSLEESACRADMMPIHGGAEWTKPTSGKARQLEELAEQNSRLASARTSEEPPVNAADGGCVADITVVSTGNQLMSCDQHRLAEAKRRRLELEARVSSLHGGKDWTGSGKVTNGKALTPSEFLFAEQTAVKSLEKKVRQLEELAEQTSRRSRGSTI